MTGMNVPCLKSWGMGGVLLAFMLLAVPGRAEEKKGEYRLDAIKVSAQKREENVQEVPLSVGVVSDVLLEETRTSELNDLGRIIPNLYISTAGGAGTFSYVGIRGRINSNVDVDPTVTVLVDGVPYDDFYSMSNNLLFDVERIEVLRGPQSTLYGLNSQAGVINIVTKQPDDNKRAKLFGEVAGSPEWDGSWRVGGSLSGPLVEGTLAGGISLMSKGQAGYIENENTGNKYNDDHLTGARGNLVWTPAEDWKITTGLAYSDLGANYGYTMLPYDNKSAASIGQTQKDWKADLDWDGMSEVKTWAPNIKVNYDSDPMEIISISAYRKTLQKYDFDFDLTPTPTLFGASDNQFQTFTQEVRLQSKKEEDSSLEWMTGYFFHAFDRHQKLGTGNPATSAVTYFIDSKLKGQSHAIFGQGTYRVLDDKLGLTLGLRQEWTSRDVESLANAFPETSITDSQFLPKFALDYRFNPDAMMYASITQGWRSGGLNPYSMSAANLEFKKETSWTYEVGARTQWLDRSLLLNASAFYTIYDDYQDDIRVGPLSRYLANAPEVRIMGLETEAEARLSKAVLLTGFLGYVNAEYRDFPDAVVGNFKGNKVISVPDFNASLALRYSFLEHFYIRPEVQGVGTIYWDRANTTKQDPYLTFNLKTGYSKDNYEIYLFGENLTNEYAFTQVTDYFQNGNYFGSPITPLRVGVGMSVDF